MIADPQNSQNLSSHWAELRHRLLMVLSAMIVAVAVCYLYVDQIYSFLVQPLADAMAAQGGTQRLIYTGLGEGFFTFLRIAFFAGLFLSFPILLYQIWKFIAPALYKSERLVFIGFLVATPLLFFAGGLCVYYVILPAVWPFFLGFQTTGEETILPLQLETRVSEYLDMIMALMFAFGLSFQLPVVLGLLGRAGVISAEFLSKGRKYAAVLVFIAAAFLTPPDIMSQLMLALPLLFLYELSIILVRYVGRKS